MILDAPRVPYAFAEIELLPGRDGIIQTLKIMRTLVRQYKRDGHLRAVAQSIVESVPLKSWTSEAQAVLNFVRSTVRYTLDTNGVELIQTPDRLLDTRFGDCDDMSLLLATLLESIGHPTRFVAVGLSPGELTHVYVQTRIGDRWIGADPTEPYPLGWEPPNVADVFVLNN